MKDMSINVINIIYAKGNLYIKTTIDTIDKILKKSINVKY